MAINLADPFNFKAPWPIDLRMRRGDINGRNSIAVNDRWEGMIVYVVSEQTWYGLVGGTGNENWVEIGQVGAGGGSTSLLTGTDPVINWNGTATDRDGIPVTDSWAQLYGNAPTIQVWLEVSSGNYSLETVPVTMAMSGGNIQTVTINTSGVPARIIIK